MHDADGAPIGRVLDLVMAVDTGEHRPLVTRVMLGPRSDVRLVDAHELARWDDDAIELRRHARPVPVRRTRGAIELRDDELLLVRDVLDTQVVDIDGRRLARVTDIALEPRDDGRMIVAGVDVGFARMFDRMGLRRTGARRDDRFIDWKDLHLAFGRGHDVQLAAPKSAVHRLDATGLAALLERLDVESGAQVLQTLPPARAAEAIVSGRHRTGERLLRALPEASAHRIVHHMSHPHRPHWERRLATPRALRGRRFHRFDGWRRHHPESR